MVCRFFLGFFSLSFFYLLNLTCAVISEVILATKEVNEKTRNLAYKVRIVGYCKKEHDIDPIVQLLVEMGNALKRATEQQDEFTVHGNIG